MRSLTQPGRPDGRGDVAVPCTARHLKASFQPGKSVLEAVSEAFEPLGIESAVVAIDGGAFDPLVYVMPALSNDGLHAAWYSDVHAPAGRGTIGQMVFTYGRRDTKPFLHCHGTWRHADGSLHCGHLMPHDARFAETVEANVIAVSGAILDQLDDPETGFRLFTPVSAEGAVPADGRRALLCRLKPNQEIHHAIEKLAGMHGMASASIHGIGSLVGCDFADGRHMASPASELYVRSGVVAANGDDVAATLDIGIVGIDGRIYEGVIHRGSNPVCITAELLIVEK